MVCSMNAFPKPQVTWERQQITDSGELWQPLVVEVPNSRYTVGRLPSQLNAINGSAGMTKAASYMLKVKQVQGPQDFGRYRCRAENKIGVSYSDSIMLTGTKALLVHNFNSCCFILLSFIKYSQITNCYRVDRVYRFTGPTAIVVRGGQATRWNRRQVARTRVDRGQRGATGGIPVAVQTTTGILITRYSNSDFV